MYQVEAKLARWKQLYVELNQLQSKLSDGTADRGTSTLQMMSDVRRLQRESEQALDEVHAAVAARAKPDRRLGA